DACHRRRRSAADFGDEHAPIVKVDPHAERGPRWDGCGFECESVPIERLAIIELVSRLEMFRKPAPEFVAMLNAGNIDCRGSQIGGKKTLLARKTLIPSSAELGER